MKKISLSLVVFASGMFFSGCWNGKASTSQNIQMVPSAPKATEENESTGLAEDAKAALPAPTGKVDDTVDAIIGQANGEALKVQSDEIDAKSSVDASEELNNLNQSYDQNEL